MMPDNVLGRRSDNVLPIAKFLLVVMFWGIFGLVASIAAAQDSQDSLDNRIYRLGVGDQLRITVFNEPDLSGEFEVGPTGHVNLPLIGKILAEGQTIEEFEDAAEEEFLNGYLKSPNVSAEVLNYRPFYILGEVNAPGSYPYVSGMTVINAVALAGGFTYRASEDTALLKRSGEESEITTEMDTLVLPGDVLTIEERFF